MLVFASVVFFNPNLLGHPTKLRNRKSSKYPCCNRTEWYFLTFYAILRAVPNKLVGVLALLASIIVLVLLLLFHRYYRSARFKVGIYAFYSLFVFDVVVLAWCGSQTQHHF